MKTLSSEETFKRIKAIEALVSEGKTSRQKLEAVRKLVKGMDKRVDDYLTKLSVIVKRIEQVQKGKVVDLALAALPAKSAQNKKRKKLLLIYLARRKQLEGEVARVKKEAATGTAGSAARIIGFAKGPWGLTTLLAGAIVGVGMWLNQAAVTVDIVNLGCDTIEPSEVSRYNLPGLKLPSEPIVPGGKATAILPPIKAQVDATNPSQVKIGLLGVNLSFNLQSSGIEVDYDGQPVLGKNQVIDLGSSTSHQVVVKCGA